VDYIINPVFHLIRGAVAGMGRTSFDEKETESKHEVTIHRYYEGV
jgi:hypothetical protein